ncbi:MAG: hypothetical protein AAGH89_05805 [Verrucomicrobiota bacterium]
MNALACITILLQFTALLILSMLGEVLPAAGADETINWLPTTIIGVFIVLQIASTFLIVSARTKRDLWFGAVWQSVTVGPLIYLHVRMMINDGWVWVFLPCFATAVFLILGIRSRFSALSLRQNQRTEPGEAGKPDPALC